MGDAAERELRSARQVLEGLLPRASPEVPGFQIDGWWQPLADAGGDIYDWLPLPGGRALITLADVTGHGLAAALLAVGYRAYLRACVEHLDLLNALVATVDGLLVRDLRHGRNVIAAIGILDAAAGSLALCCAGHGGAMHYRATARVVECLEADGPPLGIGVGTEAWVSRTVAFAPGDVLLLVTDGFYEWRNAEREEFGHERLGAALRHHAHHPPRELITALYEEVVAFAHDPEQRDDLAALVVRRSPRVARTDTWQRARR